MVDPTDQPAMTEGSCALHDRGPDNTGTGCPLPRYFRAPPAEVAA